MTEKRILMRVKVDIFNNSFSTLNLIQGPEWFEMENPAASSISPKSTMVFTLDATDRTSLFPDDVYYAADTYDTTAPRFDFHFQCTEGNPLGLAVNGAAPSGFTCKLIKNEALDYLNREVIFEVDAS